MEFLLMLIGTGPSDPGGTATNWPDAIQALGLYAAGAVVLATLVVMGGRALLSKLDCDCEAAKRKDEREAAKEERDAQEAGNAGG